MSTTVLSLYDVMSGGAFASATVFALGVQPYINSSIIIQLLTIAIPPWAVWHREGGEEGKKKIQSITRYATVAIAILQGWGYYALMKNASILTNTGVWAALVIIISFIAGSSFVMWMGEQVTEFGIGNGISIILFAGILSRVPSSMVSGMSISLKSGAMQWWHALLVVIGILALIVLITWVNGAERRIPVQYAKRQVGRKMYGGQASTLPMKVNMSGVLPIIFAQSIAMIPSPMAAFLPKPEEGTFAYTLVNAVDTKSAVYDRLLPDDHRFQLLYATIQFNPVEISNNLKKNGGFIPGFRPGNPTAAFIRRSSIRSRSSALCIWASWLFCLCSLARSSMSRLCPSAAPPSSSWSVLRWRPFRLWSPRC